jgi:hypothetical protein
MTEGSRRALTVEEVAQIIGASEATAYRYLGELCESGLLSRRTGLYVLGPKVIELEFIIRSCDPIMHASEDVLRRLAETTGCNVLLCNIYNETIVNVFHAFGREPLDLIFTKGRPMPLFRGSQARAILSVLDRRQLKRIFERHEGDPDLKRIPPLPICGVVAQTGTRSRAAHGDHVTRSFLNIGQHHVPMVRAAFNDPGETGSAHAILTRCLDLNARTLKSR